MTSGSWYHRDHVYDHDALLRRFHATSPMTMAGSRLREPSRQLRFLADEHIHGGIIQ
jgi:hypothetical protein